MIGSERDRMWWNRRKSEGCRVVVCFHRPFTSQHLVIGLEPVVTTEGLCVSGTLFNFLSVLEKPAGSGNESANRTHAEGKRILSSLIAVSDGRLAF